jgi:hypothetical protein
MIDVYVLGGQSVQNHHRVNIAVLGGFAPAIAALQTHKPEPLTKSNMQFFQQFIHPGGNVDHACTPLTSYIWYFIKSHSELQPRKGKTRKPKLPGLKMHRLKNQRLEN